VILVSATESDCASLLAASEFLLDPGHLTVTLTRAKQKLILVASRSIFELFSANGETFYAFAAVEELAATEVYE
jgi:superfamily I DNA and/or RNA helicase